jgi:hypothetical protein
MATGGLLGYLLIPVTVFEILRLLGGYPIDLDLFINNLFTSPILILNPFLFPLCFASLIFGALVGYTLSNGFSAFFKIKKWKLGAVLGLIAGLFAPLFLISLFSYQPMSTGGGVIILGGYIIISIIALPVCTIIGAFVGFLVDIALLKAAPKTVIVNLVAIVAILLFLVILWQLGGFNQTPRSGRSPSGYQTDFNPPDVIVTGWEALQPLSSSASYKSTVNQSFTATFNNFATSIKMSSVHPPTRIIGINVTEVLSSEKGTNCKGFGGPYVNGIPQADLTSGNVVVDDGSTFTIEAFCADSNTQPKVSADRRRGDPYKLLIYIQHKSELGQNVFQHTEVGTIRGTVE